MSNGAGTQPRSKAETVCRQLVELPLKNLFIQLRLVVELWSNLTAFSSLLLAFGSFLYKFSQNRNDLLGQRSILFNCNALEFALEINRNSKSILLSMAHFFLIHHTYHLCLTKDVFFIDTLHMF